MSAPITVTERLIIVIRPHLQAQAENVIAVAEPTNIGPVFNVMLRVKGDPTMAVAAYWCNWAMTLEMRQRILAEFGKSFAKAIEPLPRGARVRLQDDFWVFDAWDQPGDKPLGWTNQEVLDALNFDTPEFEN